MNPILEFFADRQDLLFLALVILEITVIGCLGLLGIRFNRHDAATRYGIGLSALILVAIAAPATWFMQNSAWTTLAWERVIMIDPTFVPIDMPQPAPEPVPAWIWVWGVGVGLVFARIGLGFLRVHMLRRDSFRLEKLSNGVAVYATDDAGPAVVGALRPAVLMPRKLLDSLSDEEIHDVLAHEFAHVAHRHLIVALFQRILAALYWPHPLIHLLNREMIAAREEMCDNAVLRSAGAARYARVLLRVAECRLQPRQFSASLGLFGPSTSLEKRVKSLLDPNRRIESNMNKRKIVVACTALTMGMAAVAGARVQTQVVVPTEQTKPTSVPSVIIELGEAKAKKRVKPAKQKKAKATKSLAIKRAAAVPQVPSAPAVPGVAIAPTAASPVLVQGIPVAPAAPAVAPIKAVNGVAVPLTMASPAQAPGSPATVRYLNLPAAPQHGKAGSPRFYAVPTAPQKGVGFMAFPSAPQKGRAGSTTFYAVPTAPQKTDAYRVFEYQKANENYLKVYGTAKANYRVFPDYENIQRVYKTLEPGKLKGRTLNGTAFFGTQATPGKPGQKADDPFNYQNMKGEDRPDLLTHPMGVPKTQDKSKSRSLTLGTATLKDRAVNRALGLATTSRLKSDRLNTLGTATVRDNVVNRALGVEATTRLKSDRLITLGAATIERANVDRKVERLNTTNVARVKSLLPTTGSGSLSNKDNLDKATEYRLKYNSETKQWEVIPVTKSGKG